MACRKSRSADASASCSQFHHASASKRSICPVEKRFHLFDSASSKYYLVGVDGFVAENQFGTNTSALQQAATGVQGTGVTGLLPPQVTFTVTQRF